MMTPKRRLLALIFACLCFKKSILMKNIKFIEIKGKDAIKFKPRETCMEVCQMTHYYLITKHESS